MIKYLPIILVFSCASDIAIISPTKYISDTGDTVLEPSTEPSVEPPDDMSELTIGFAEMSLTQIACPACMGVSYEFDIFANLKLHQPTTGGYNEGLTPVGTCVTQELGSYVSSTPLSVSGNASFNSVLMYPAGQAEWTVNNILEHQFPRSQSIQVTTDAGNISDAFETLEGFDDIQPWELRYVDPSYAFAAVVSKLGTTFTWQPVLAGAQFEIMIVVYSPDGSQLLGLVSCMENDVGYMTVSGDYFQAYPYNALTAIYLSRHRVDKRPAPEFNGYLESHMVWTVLGTGHIE